MCFLVLFPEGRRGLDVGAGRLELQCIFIWGDNQGKKVSTSNSVAALISFNEEYHYLLKLQVPLK